MSKVYGLSQLKIKEVSLVDKGANPGAYAMIWKAADGEPTSKAQMKMVDGEEHPASHFAYVPDAEKPSTWKLLVHDARHVGMAAAALGPGFRGEKVEIPDEDMPSVKAKVRSAWQKMYPDKDMDEMPDGIKKSMDEAVSILKGALDDYTAAIVEDNPAISWSEAVAIAKQALDDDPQSTNEGNSMPGTDLQDQVTDLTKRVGDLESERDALTKRAEAAESERDTLKDAIEKVKVEKRDPDTGLALKDDGTPDWGAVDEPMRAMAKAMWAQKEKTAELEKRLADEKAASVAKAYVTKAGSYEHLAVKPEEFGPLLHKAAGAMTEDEFGELDRVLRAADEAAASNLFAQKGASDRGQGFSKAEDALDAKAKEIAKRDSISYEQAFVKALDENHDLAAAERHERDINTWGTR